MNICFIVAESNRGNILDRIAHEIGKVFDEPIYHYGIDNVPKADQYFITHYSMLPIIIAQVNPGITPITSFFTHDKGISVGGGLINYVEAFNLCHSVIAESPEGMKLLAGLGVRHDILHFLPEGGDNEAFKPHARTDDGAILVCGTNYGDGRKNPKLINQVVGKLPYGKFILLGENWNTKLFDLPNVTIHMNADYNEYPKLYSDCSVYLSCSKLEGGGPNSLIEAMHANLVPIVSDTGNARQYIIDSYNGFIFPLNSTPEYIATLIEQAYCLHPQDSMPYADIWQTVKQFTWPIYAMNMKEIITGDYSHTSSQSLDEFDNGLEIA